MEYEKPMIVDFGSIAKSTFTLLGGVLGKKTGLLCKLDLQLGDVCTTP